MVLDWFSRSKQANIQGLIAQRDFGGAIAQIRAQLQKRKGDERLRVRLADVLVQAGRKDEAVGILMPLADDLALQGLAAKSIAILKRVNQLRPRDAEVEEKLAYMISQQLNPSAGPWKQRSSAEPAARAEPEIGMEEIGNTGAFGMEEIGNTGAFGMEAVGELPPDSDTPSAAEAPAPAAPPGKPAAPGPPASSRAGAAPSTSATAPAPAPPDVDEVGETPPEGFAFDEAFRDQLASLLEDVFTPVESEPSDAPPAAASPMIDTPLFKDFSQEELVAVIRGLQLRIFEPGEIVMTAGEPGESLFILTSGVVRAYMRKPDGTHVPLRQMREGDFFGEISALTGNPRSATITAASNCDLLELDRKTLDEISKLHPHVREVLQQFYAQRAGHSVKTAREQQ